jgi:integrase
MRLGLLHYLEFAMDRFQKLLKDSNIARHRFHDLRHTAATLLAVQGFTRGRFRPSSGGTKSRWWTGTLTL